MTQLLVSVTVDLEAEAGPVLHIYVEDIESVIEEIEARGWSILGRVHTDGASESLSTRSGTVCLADPPSLVRDE